MSEPRDRNQHERQSLHFGTLPATLVSLSAQLGPYVVGTSVEDFLRALSAQIERVEGISGLIDSHFVLDAVLFKAQSSESTGIPIYYMNAEIVGLSGSGSFSADAITKMNIPGTFSLNAVIPGAAPSGGDGNAVPGELVPGEAEYGSS